MIRAPTQNHDQKDFLRTSFLAVEESGEVDRGLEPGDEVKELERRSELLWRNPGGTGAQFLFVNLSILSCIRPPSLTSCSQPSVCLRRPEPTIRWNLQYRIGRYLNHWWGNFGSERNCGRTRPSMVRGTPCRNQQRRNFRPARMKLTSPARTCNVAMRSTPFSTHTPLRQSRPDTLPSPVCG